MATTSDPTTAELLRASEARTAEALDALAETFADDLDTLRATVAELTERVDQLTAALDAVAVADPIAASAAGLRLPLSAALRGSDPTKGD